MSSMCLDLKSNRKVASGTNHWNVDEGRFCFPSIWDRRRETHHWKRDITVIDDADKKDASFSTCRPSCINREPEVTEKERVERRGVASNEVVYEILDFGCSISNISYFCSACGIAKSTQDVLNLFFCEGFLSQQSMQHCNASPQVKNILFEKVKCFLSPTNTLSSTA